MNKKDIKNISKYILIPIIFHGLGWFGFFIDALLKKYGAIDESEILGFVLMFYSFIMIIVMPILMIRMAIKHLKDYKWDPLYITIYSTIFIAAVWPLFWSFMFGIGVAGG